jgi:hypothetical protein
VFDFLRFADLQTLICILLVIWCASDIYNVKVNCGTQTQSEAAGLCDVSLTAQLALRETPTGKSSIPNFGALRNQISFGLLA